MDMPMGCEKDFAEFYEKYNRRIIFYLMGYVCDFSTAEDLAHDTFLKLYDKRDSIKYGTAGTRSYLYKSAKNIAIDYQRKQEGENRKHDRCIEVIRDVDDSFYSEVEDFIIEGEVVSTVGDVLEQFPEKSRRIFVDRFLKHKQMQKISMDEKLSFYKIKKIQKEIIDKMKDELRVFLDYNA